MPAPSKIEQFRRIVRLPQAGFAAVAMITLVALVVFGPILPKAALWQVSDMPSSSPGAAQQQTWAGHLENLAEPPQTSAGAPLTSASYTSGFDKTAAGLVPARVSPIKPPQAGDLRACPSGLNCSFRTVKAARHATDIAAIVLPQPATQPAIVPAVAMPAPRPNGLAVLTSRLPSPHALLRPFTFVADTFTGFIRKL